MSSSRITDKLVQVPKDLEAALGKDALALAAWDKIPPSHKKEYLKWINEAKKPQTRERRIEQTVRRLTSAA